MSRKKTFTASYDKEFSMKMRFKLVEKFSRNGLATHYAKHVKQSYSIPDEEKFDSMAPYEYEEKAESLMKEVAGLSTSEDDIVGFQDKDGRYEKYKKSTNELVVYDPKNNQTISYYKATIDSYVRKLKKYFYDELPENKYSEEDFIEYP